MPGNQSAPALPSLHADFGYVRTRHTGMDTRIGGLIVDIDYGVWAGGAAPLDARPWHPAGTYCGRIAYTTGGLAFATPDDGDHSWAGLNWYGPFLQRQHAAVWLAGWLNCKRNRTRT